MYVVCAAYGCWFGWVVVGLGGVVVCLAAGWIGLVTVFVVFSVGVDCAFWWCRLCF